MYFILCFLKKKKQKTTLLIHTGDDRPSDSISGNKRPASYGYEEPDPHFSPQKKVLTSPEADTCPLTTFSLVYVTANPPEKYSHNIY